MNNLYDYFENVFNENKLVQSYLIGNTRFNEIKDDLFKVLNKFFFKSNGNLEENPDLYLLTTEEGIVSKEAIKDLIKKINTTSQFNNVKVYVIDECEKLNDFSFNAILKTLEEPAPNVYAFLLTGNMDSVKPTIVSRCQKIFISSEVKEEDFTEEVISLSEELIRLIENEGIKTIGRHPEIYNKITDRDCFKSILKYMQNKYVSDLNNAVNNNEIINENVELIAKKILVINNNINITDGYLNKNLFIDKFIIEMWRCNNENS